MTNSDSYELGENVFYQEYDRVWSVSLPVEAVFGRLEERVSGSNQTLPIANEEVFLFRCNDQDGLVGSTLTDNNGQYRFDGEALELLDGNYQLRFPVIAGLELQTNRFQLFSNGFTNCINFTSAENRRASFFGLDPSEPINATYSTAP